MLYLKLGSFLMHGLFCVKESLDPQAEEEVPTVTVKRFYQQKLKNNPTTNKGLELNTINH